MTKLKEDLKGAIVIAKRVHSKYDGSGFVATQMLMDDLVRKNSVNKNKEEASKIKKQIKALQAKKPKNKK